MASLPIRAVGLVWYRRNDYSRVLQIMTDADELPPTWDKWLYRAEQALRRFEKSGMVVEKVYLDPEIFPGWCEARGLEIDAKARIAFVNAAVREMHGGTH